ncbi:MAG: hypothetical protein ACTSUE_06600 [Promethearchaeota archaeon]
MGKEIETFVEKHIAAFKEMKQDLEELRTVLDSILNGMSIELHVDCFIQTRVKTVASFAGKIMRDGLDDVNSFDELTDLCAGRVICSTLHDVALFCKQLEQHFIVCWESCIDKASQLESNEFGYLSKHYIVKLDPKSRHIPDLDIPESLFGIRAEIQVRTILQHYWASISHKIDYKGQFPLPDKIKRELNRYAALLETVDSEMQEMLDFIRNFQVDYDATALLSEGEIKEQIEKLKIIINNIPPNDPVSDILIKLSKLSRYLGKWDFIVEMLEPFADLDNPRILKELGLAMCKGQDNPVGNKKYKRGQEYLEKAIELDPGDTDAMGSLAGTWKKYAISSTRIGGDEHSALEAWGNALKYYKMMLKEKPGNSYGLTNYLICGALIDKSRKIIDDNQFLYNDAIEACKKQASLGLNMPWAYFDIALLHLLSGRFFKSLIHYLLGIHFSKEEWMITTTLQTLQLLDHLGNDVGGGIEYLDVVENLLSIGIEFCTLRNADDVAAVLQAEVVPELKAGHLETPIIIIAGSTSREDDELVSKYRDVLIKVLKDFRGTIISGGTRSGVSGIIGDIQEVYPESIYTVGYVSSDSRDQVDIDARYKEIRNTPGFDFSPAEPIEYWTDIIRSGIDPREVLILGILGGEISAFEYFLGALLGCRVGVIDFHRSRSYLVIKDVVEQVVFSIMENIKDLDGSLHSLTQFLSGFAGFEGM